MTTTHTPGPWAYDQESDNSTDFWVFQENGPARIAVEVSERDAALIAAAPDLLAALHQCLRYGGLYPDLAENVRAAITRATGA
jgi:hypothetical protein